MKLSTRWAWVVVSRILLPLAVVFLLFTYTKQPNSQHDIRTITATIPSQRSVTLAPGAANAPNRRAAGPAPPPAPPLKPKAAGKPPVSLPVGTLYTVGNALIQVTFKAVDAVQSTTDLLGAHVTAAVPVQGQSLQYQQVMNLIHERSTDVTMPLLPTLFETRDAGAVLSSNQCTITDFSSTPMVADQAPSPIFSALQARFLCHHGKDVMTVLWRASAKPGEHFLHVSVVLVPEERAYTGR